jgi:hypothetical protein
MKGKNRVGVCIKDQISHNTNNNNKGYQNSNNNKELDREKESKIYCEKDKIDR